MTQSLMELLSSDLGASVQVKTAAQTGSDTVSIEKIAAELGLFGDTQPAAAPAAAPAATAAPEAAGSEKTAAPVLGDLFSMCFPDDALGGTKTASSPASAEELCGERAHQYFATRFDDRITKLAYAALSGNVGDHDSQPPNHPPNNKGERDAGGGPINTTPKVDNEVKPENGPAVVGQEGAGGGAIKSAMAKHFLLAGLDQ